MAKPESRSNAGPLTIVVTYARNPDGGPLVTVVPGLVKPSRGGTLRFERAGIMEGSLRLTFKDKDWFQTNNPQFGKTGIVNEGDGDVRVIAPVSAQTTRYSCELVDEKGVVIANSPAGGAVEVAQ